MPFYTLSKDLIVIEIPGKWHFKGNFYGYLTVESAEDPQPPGPLLIPVCWIRLDYPI